MVGQSLLSVAMVLDMETTSYLGPALKRLPGLCTSRRSYDRIGMDCKLLFSARETFSIDDSRVHVRQRKPTQMNVTCAVICSCYDMQGIRVLHPELSFECIETVIVSYVLTNQAARCVSVLNSWLIELAGTPLTQSGAVGWRAFLLPFELPWSNPIACRFAYCNEGQVRHCMYTGWQQEQTMSYIARQYVVTL